MGNSNSSESVVPEFEFGTRKGFGSVNDPSNPRPGYYYNQNTRTLKYHTTPIEILPGETSFKKLKYGYFKTNKRVFYKGVQIKSVNPANFTTLTIPEVKSTFPHLAKLNSVVGIDQTNNRIYHKGKLIS
jgi:hypothetical protein